VLNKSDLVDAAGAADAKRLVAAALGRGVKTVSAAHGRIDAAVLLGLAAAAEDDLANRPSHHDAAGGEHDHDDFESFALELEPVADPAALEARLIQAVEAHDILRIKGFLDVPGRPRRHVVQGVGARFQRYYDRDWQTNEARRSAVVIIGRKGLDRAAIAAMIGAEG